MKLAISKEHRHYFQEHQMIEFDALLNPNELKAVNENIQSHLNKKDFSSSEQIFLNSRDLWRNSEVLQSIIKQKKLLEVIAELLETKVLRLGYDQFFPTPEKYTFGKNLYHDLLQQPHTLKEISSLQGVVGGLMFCLTSNSEEMNSTFPSLTGNGMIFNANAIIDFPYLLSHPNTYYLVVYTKSTAVFVYNDKDPLSNAFKDLGYNYGDKLLDKTNPIVFR